MMVIATHILLYLREIVIALALAAALSYLIMYQREPARKNDLVSNMLLHLGWMQVIVYSGALIRLIVLPLIDGPEWLEGGILLLLNFSAMSLTVFVLITYVVTRRRGRLIDEAQARLDLGDPPEWRQSDEINRP